MNELQDRQGARFGMWLFLFTEIMLFGGLFVIYAAYFHRYPEAFAVGGQSLDTTVGTLNTAILLASSFAVAATLTSLKKGSKRVAVLFLGNAAILGVIFLVNKYFEWSHKIEGGIYPNSDLLLEMPQGEIIFYGLYYTMTGLHALHVFIGVGVLTVCVIMIIMEKITGEKISVLENSGLYWHLVDLVWIFLFPLFYLLL